MRSITADRAIAGEKPATTASLEKEHVEAKAKIGASLAAMEEAP